MFRLIFVASSKLGSVLGKFSFVLSKLRPFGDQNTPSCPTFCPPLSFFAVYLCVGTIISYPVGTESGGHFFFSRTSNVFQLQKLSPSRASHLLSPNQGRLPIYDFVKLLGGNRGEWVVFLETLEWIPAEHQWKANNNKNQRTGRRPGKEDTPGRFTIPPRLPDFPYQQSSWACKFWAHEDTRNFSVVFKLLYYPTLL